MSDDYDQKLRDMQKYVPFLENLIQNLKKNNKQQDEKREAQLNKMQMFYELLTNKNKKLKLETLERCEQVLVKLHQKAEKIKNEMPSVKASTSTTSSSHVSPVISTQSELLKVDITLPKIEEKTSTPVKNPSAEIKSSDKCSNLENSTEIIAATDTPVTVLQTESSSEENKSELNEQTVGDNLEEKDCQSESLPVLQATDERQTASQMPISELEVESPEKSVTAEVSDDWKSQKRKAQDGPSESTATEPANDEDETQSSDLATGEKSIPMEDDTSEPEPACSSMEVDDEDSKIANSPEKTDSRQNDTENPQPAVVSYSTMKNDPEDCSVSSTTVIDPRRDKRAGDESDEQNSLQDTVTGSSGNDEDVNKEWIQGALLNLLSPKKIDKSTVLEMLGKVVDDGKLEKIKAILGSEESKSTSPNEEESAKPEENKQEDVAECEENKAALPIPEPATPPVSERKGPQTRHRRSEIDRLNADIRFMLQAEPKASSTNKRTCAESKASSNGEMVTQPKPTPKKARTIATDALPKPKKKKKKYEVFSYRTRRRSKRKKPKPKSVAELQGGTESGADGTESSLGGGDSLVDEIQKDDEEAEGEDLLTESTNVEMSEEQIAEAEKNFKNIHPEMHSLSKFNSTCAICNFSGRYVTTHYINSHRMTEMVVSRLPPTAQARFMRGEGVQSIFSGKDAFQNRMYQYSCPFCNVKKSFARKIWSQHFGSHTGEYKYKCSGCGYMSVNVRGHILKYCPEARPIMMENLDRGQDIVGFICKLCNFIQMNREHIVNHLETQHELKDGTDELITELTLFRSDTSSYANCGRKPQKAIQPEETKSTPVAKTTPVTKTTPAAKSTPKFTPKSTPKSIPKSTPIAKLMSTLPKQQQTTPVAGPSQVAKKAKPIVQPPSEAEDELLEEIATPAAGGEIIIPKSVGGKPIKNIYPYMHSQSEYVNRCVKCNFTGKFITKHYVKEHPDSEVFVSRVPPDRQTCLLANKPLAKLGPMTVVKYKSYYRHAACPFCTVEKSSQRFDWVMHYTIHTGEYKFRCSQCYHHGNARNEFARHFKLGCPKGKLIRLWSTYKYNEEDPILGYFCNICNFLQMSRNNVERHLKTQHGSTPDNLTQITLFTGNPRYKGRRSLGSGKKSKRHIRKIQHAVECGVLNVPDFLCEGGFVDEEFMADDVRRGGDEDGDEENAETGAGQMEEDDDELVLPMHQLSHDFTDSGFENLFQMEMDETGVVEAEDSSAPAESGANNTSVNDGEELIRPTEDPPMNIHSEMHALSTYASKCLLCNFAGKYIAKHYIEEHTDYEVFSSRLPPEGQRRLLTGEACMPIEAVVRSRKFHYYFSCPFCNLERFCTRHNWVAHFAIHTGEYKYQCSHCSHRGNASRDFKNHFKGKCRHGQQIRIWPDLVSKEEPIVAYFCNLCNFIQLERSRVIQHLNTQHSCYEQLVSKVTLMFIDPKASVTEAPTTLPANIQQKMMNRKGGRPRLKPWPSTREQAAAEEEDDEYEQENESNDSENEKVSDLEDNGQNDNDDEDVIEIADSDEDRQTAKRSANTSSTSGYEKIRKFLERTEKPSSKISPSPVRRISETKKDTTVPFPPPTKDRPLSNVYPEMHSQSPYAKKCILCAFTGRHLINHYVSVHPRFEVPISRLPPKWQEQLVKGENNTATEIESNPYSPKLFSHQCLFCDTQFTFAIKSWVDHIGTHTGEYNFKCSECGRMINSKHDIQEHIKTYCKKGKALARQFPVTEKQVLLAYICKECNFIQMNRGNVIQHLRGQHKNSTPDTSIQQIVLIRFGKATPAKVELKPILGTKREDRIKVQNTHGDTKYTTREYVKVEQSDALCEILVPKTELSVTAEMPSTSARVKMEKTGDERTGGVVPRVLTQGGLYAGMPQLRPIRPQIVARRSAPPAPNLVSSGHTGAPAQPGVVKRISQLGYSQTADGTRYHCCVRSCTFTPTTVPIALATHIMDEHASLIWEGYCRECQGHVATGKNMKLTKEIQHLFEHTRKRPAEITDTREGNPPKVARHSIASTTRGNPTLDNASPSPPDESANQIIARFAKSKSITITRESKASLSGSAPSIVQSVQRLTPNASNSKQQQVLKEVKRTALKPWTVSKSVKSESVIRSLLGDLSLFGFFKCMGNECTFTTNDSNKIAEHLSYHSEHKEREVVEDELSSDSNVSSWLECCYCSTWAGTVMQLIAHITAKHSRDIYQCPYCFYRSCDESNVMVHLKHYHARERIRILYCFGRKVLKPGGDAIVQAVKRTKCSVCPCMFVNPIAFATNIAEYTDTDLGGDIYKCYYCSKKHTKSLTEFARHIVEHRPVRKADSYQCLKCFKAQIKIPTTTNKPTLRSYQCVHCAFSSDEEVQMSLHMAQVHGSNLLFCGLRIRMLSNTPTNDNHGNRLDNAAAFVLLKKNVDERIFYKCPFTPAQLNYHETKIQIGSSPQDAEADEMGRESNNSPVVAQNPMGLQIATVQSITSTEFESFITIDDDDD